MWLASFVVRGLSRSPDLRGLDAHPESEDWKMKYVMLVCRDPSIELSAQQRTTIGPEVDAWLQEMEERGVHRQGGGELSPVQDATTIRVRGDEVVISDGPFAETKEQIAGFDILDCADLDEAMEVAAKHPVARLGALELRPFAEG